ncbi:unnamed protein product, partial [Prorocentrum cordatum]
MPLEVCSRLRLGTRRLLVADKDKARAAAPAASAAPTPLLLGTWGHLGLSQAGWGFGGGSSSFGGATPAAAGYLAPPRYDGREMARVGGGALAPQWSAIPNMGGQEAGSFSGEATQHIPTAGLNHEVMFKDLAAMGQQKERDHDKAAELYEIARTRVDQEQIERKIDLTTAQQLDDEAMWGLGDAYASGGRLTLAFNTFSILKERYDGLQKKKAQQRWADVAFMLGCALYK